FLQLLGRVRKTALEAYAHQDLPFEKLVAELQPVRRISYSPIFQVMFILQNTPMPSAEAAGIKFRHFDIDAGSSKMDLTLNLEEVAAGGAEGWVEYSTDLFEKGTILRVIKQYEGILNSVVNRPDARLS